MHFGRGPFPQFSRSSVRSPAENRENSGEFNLEGGIRAFPAAGRCSSQSSEPSSPNGRKAPVTTEALPWGSQGRSSSSRGPTDIAPSGRTDAFGPAMTNRAAPVEVLADHLARRISGCVKYWLGTILNSMSREKKELSIDATIHDELRVMYETSHGMKDLSRNMFCRRHEEIGT